MEPKFWSTGTSFYVRLYNLNYHIPVENMLIEEEKVLIGSEKVSIEEENRLMNFKIDELKFNINTKANIKRLFACQRYDGIFGRDDIMKTSSIGITAAGNLINKLKNVSLIEEVRGFGKGKYRFVKYKGN